MPRQWLNSGVNRFSMTNKEMLDFPGVRECLTEIHAGRCGCGCGQKSKPEPTTSEIIKGEESLYIEELKIKIPKWYKIIKKKFKGWDEVTGVGLADLMQTYGVPADVVEHYFNECTKGQVLKDYIEAWRTHRKISGR